MGTCSSRSAAAPAARPSASGKGATAAGKARWPRNAALDDESKAEPVMNAQTGEVRAVSERARARAREATRRKTDRAARERRAREEARRAPPTRFARHRARDTRARADPSRARRAPSLSLALRRSKTPRTPRATTSTSTRRRPTRRRRTPSSRTRTTCRRARARRERERGDEAAAAAARLSSALTRATPPRKVRVPSEQEAMMRAILDSARESGSLGKR